MAHAKTRNARLRDIFERDETVLVPIAALPMHAAMAEKAGFECFHISGAFAAMWLTGQPDVGLMTRSQVLDNARAIVDAVDIPVYCDADTGYGSIPNVWKCVQDFIRAGVSGIHIEDQQDPKRAGNVSGIALVSDEEAIGRINAACDARDALDPTFVIAARTDGYGAAGGGLAEAIRRGKLYREKTRADVIFFEGIATWDEVRIALGSVAGPCYAIPAPFREATPPLAELTRMKQAINIVPFIMPAMQESWKLLLDVAAKGELKPMDDYVADMLKLYGTPQYAGAGEAFLKPTYEQVRQLEETYLPPEKWRIHEDR